MSTGEKGTLKKLINRKIVLIFHNFKFIYPSAKEEFIPEL